MRMSVKSLTVMTTLSALSVLVITDCDPEGLQQMHRRFATCDRKYKENYNQAMAGLGKREGQESLLSKITCQRVDNLVNVCGDTWNSCNTADQVDDLKMMYVETLRERNENASISIEQCDSIKRIK